MQAFTSGGNLFSKNKWSNKKPLRISPEGSFFLSQITTESSLTKTPQGLDYSDYSVDSYAFIYLYFYYSFDILYNPSTKVKNYFKLFFTNFSSNNFSD